MTQHGRDLNALGQTNGEDMTHTRNGTLLSHKDRKNAICSIMHGPRDYHTKQRKSERQTPYDITYIWNLKE